jgi:cyclopropane fatty-acyl-phospholipid synthase-like methyltransferase
VFSALLNRAAGAGDETREDASSKVPLGERLKAWWEGYELVLPEKPADDGEATPPAPASEPAREKIARKLWTVEQAEAAELIWGDGFICPGGEEFFLELVKPFGLTPAMSVLDLSAGLGGGTRALTNKFGVWVDGMESSPELAKRAMEKSTMAGLSKKAPVRAFNPDQLDLPKGKFDCVFAREAFFGMPDKDALMKALEKTLKDKGQIMFTDFVVRGSKLETDAVTQWRDAEPSLIWPVSADDYANLAAQLGLDMRICEDMTDKYRNLIMRGWGQFMEILKEKRLVPKTMLNVVEEAELWANRVKAFDSGDVRMYRFHLLKKKPSLMSNW